MKHVNYLNLFKNATTMHWLQFCVCSFLENIDDILPLFGKKIKFWVCGKVRKSYKCKCPGIRGLAAAFLRRGVGVTTSPALSSNPPVSNLSPTSKHLHTSWNKVFFKKKYIYQETKREIDKITNIKSQVINGEINLIMTIPCMRSALNNKAPCLLSSTCPELLVFWCPKCVKSRTQLKPS